MKKEFIYLSLFTFIFFASNAFCQKGLRWYPVKKNMPGFNEEATDKTFFADASVSFDLFVRESKTGKYKIGAIPGIGYGFRWNPKWNPLPTNALISFDLFTQASLSDELDTSSGFDFFVIDLLPVITIFDWIGIGYGPRFKVGLEGVPSSNTGVFTFGIKKTLNTSRE